MIIYRNIPIDDILEVGRSAFLMTAGKMYTFRLVRKENNLMWTISKNKKDAPILLLKTKREMKSLSIPFEESDLED